MVKRVIRLNKHQISNQILSLFHMPFPKEVMFSMKVEFLMNSSPTQNHHGDEPGPLLGPLQLESNPKFYA